MQENKHFHVQDWTRNHPYMVSDRKLVSGAMGGRSARACDNCVKNRARFYCAADDAFLCRPCDSSVHSANALARRHERVRLRVFTSSGDEVRVPGPTWHRGFTRKARTPRRRRKKKDGKFLNSDGRIVSYDKNRVHVVPEIGGDETQWPDESEDQLQLQLLYRVPMLDPDLRMPNGVVAGAQGDVKATSFGPVADLEGFAADVESLLGKRRRQEEDELLDIGEFEFLNCDEDPVKIEAFDQNLEYSRILVCPEREEEEEEDYKVINNKKPFLRLDYEGVLSKWDVQRSPWMTGERPRLNSSYGRRDISGISRGGAIMQVPSRAGREARVWRYREKRQRRLFSKRIRYEVRKQNAEKRPRVNGRFVKRVEIE